MPAIDPATLTDQLTQRYATKRFDPTRVISPERWLALEQALVLTPSGFGLQPWRFLVVDDPVLRRQLRALARDQAQVTDAARLVVFQAHIDVDAAHVARHAAVIAARRGDATAAETFRQRVTTAVVEKQTPESRREWAIRQTYIALGQFLTAAALLGIDACPMEGFDRAGYDDALGTTDGPWRSVLIAPVGYRVVDDPQAAQPKVRFDLPDVVLHR